MLIEDILPGLRAGKMYKGTFRVGGKFQTDRYYFMMPNGIPMFLEMDFPSPLVGHIMADEFSNDSWVEVNFELVTSTWMGIHGTEKEDRYFKGRDFKYVSDDNNNQR